MHTNWRDCKEWLDEKLPLSTTSNEAAKLFDATLSQLLCWKDFESLGGVEKTLENMINADPTFVLGHVMSNEIQFMSTGTSPEISKEFRKNIDLTYKLASQNPSMYDREKLHVEALRQLDEGSMIKACLVWEAILKEHPTDILALRLCQDAYFFTGNQIELKGSLDRVSNKWSPKLPYWNFLFGMKAFAYCENKQYEESAKFAKEGLKHYSKDIWSTHALAHVNEMTGQFELGAELLDDTMFDWQSSNWMSCHVHWHNAVFSIEKGDYDWALHIYDTEMARRPYESGSMLDVVDACSLLYRLQMEGVNVKDRFADLLSVCSNHANDHIYTFNDLHFLMTFLGSGERVKADEFVKSIEAYLDNQSQVTDYTETSASVGVAISKAMLSYDDGCYEDSVEFIRSIKRDMLTIGGSDAQRDVFSQLLIHAAINSKHLEHQSLAEGLLKKRKEMKANAPLTDRLAAKLLLHKKHNIVMEV